MADALVIFLHGVHGSGAQLAGLAAHLAPHLPGVAFAAPDAPWPSDLVPNGRQWFSVDAVTADNRAGRVAAARSGFDAVLAEEIAAHGLTGHEDRVALFGFSQGAIMALDLLADGRSPLSGAVAYAGRLAYDGAPHPAPGARVRLIHGAADGVIPPTESQDGARRLAAAGVQGDLQILPGQGHAVSAEGLALARDALAGWLL